MLWHGAHTQAVVGSRLFDNSKNTLLSLKDAKHNSHLKSKSKVPLQKEGLERKFTLQPQDFNKENVLEAVVHREIFFKD